MKRHHTFSEIVDWLATRAANVESLFSASNVPAKPQGEDKHMAILAPAERHIFCRSDDYERAHETAIKWLNNPMGLHTDQLAIARAYLFREDSLECVDEAYLALKKAKAENDERFMTERDEARRDLTTLRAYVLETVALVKGGGVNDLLTALNTLEKAAKGEIR